MKLLQSLAMSPFLCSSGSGVSSGYFGCKFGCQGRARRAICADAAARGRRGSWRGSEEGRRVCCTRTRPVKSGAFQCDFRHALTHEGHRCFLSLRWYILVPLSPIRARGQTGDHVSAHEGKCKPKTAQHSQKDDCWFTPREWTN